MARGYKNRGTYRGRLTFNDSLKIIVILLTALVVIVGGIYWYTDGKNPLEAIGITMPWDSGDAELPATSTPEP